jgi:hypothetical protein
MSLRQSDATADCDPFSRPTATVTQTGRPSRKGGGLVDATGGWLVGAKGNYPFLKRTTRPHGQGDSRQRKITDIDLGGRFVEGAHNEGFRRSRLPAFCPSRLLARGSSVTNGKAVGSGYRQSAIEDCVFVRWIFEREGRFGEARRSLGIDAIRSEGNIQR